MGGIDPRATAFGPTNANDPRSAAYFGPGAPLRSVGQSAPAVDPDSLPAALIPRELAHASAALDVLDARLGDLARKLDPVLMPEPPALARLNAAATAPHSPLAETVIRLRERIESLREAVDGMASRLQL